MCSVVVVMMMVEVVVMAGEVPFTKLLTSHRGERKRDEDVREQMQKRVGAVLTLLVEVVPGGGRQVAPALAGNGGPMPAPAAVLAYDKDCGWSWSWRWSLWW